MPRRPLSRQGAALRFGLGAALLAVLLVVLGTRATGLPPLGALLDPAGGVYALARASPPASERLALAGLDGEVEVVRDRRGVPHIFATTDADAVRALGFVTAQDRLFQMDFIARVAAGRLSEAVGASALDTDRFLRRTGMEWGARRNWNAIEKEGGIERDVLGWYAEGVNAFIAQMRPADVPVEMRLLGYAPERWTPLHTLRILQYMAFDLSFDRNEPRLSALRAGLDSLDFERLFPVHSPLVVPIVPTPGGGASLPATVEPYPDASLFEGSSGPAEGFIPGKGSNNWAVWGARSATGMPLLAGDMHLSLTLPAIWYEAHLATPGFNTYGVTVPGAPLPVEAYNDYIGWTFTNTGADQIDHYRLTVNRENTAYLFDGLWHDFEMVPDTLGVLRGAAVVDTLRYTHLGPVMDVDGQPVALRWTAHGRSRTMRALWNMHHATNLAEFEKATRDWDTPMQNILYAGRDGHIAIRSTGHLPVRAQGTGSGLLDGTTSRNAWTGRVPFDQLPHAVDPERGWLSSTNQDPADASYPYYLGRDWYSNLRSLRIARLLDARPQHSADDLKRYQADVHVMQFELMKPLLDTLTALAPRADSLRALLVAWDGEAVRDAAAPLAFYVFHETLRRRVWDEPVFARRRPAFVPLYLLLRDTPGSPLLDRPDTPIREDAALLLRGVLAEAADSLRARFGPPASWRWGAVHGAVFEHLTQSDALAAFSRGPFPYPGFAETLSPAADLETTHSASWRVVVDFSAQPPQGWGVYPGGQSGNPFSPHYDDFIGTYLDFRHYPLFKPAGAASIPADSVESRLLLSPRR